MRVFYLVIEKYLIGYKESEPLVSI
jgi:hypothetical protein